MFPIIRFAYANISQQLKLLAATAHLVVVMLATKGTLPTPADTFADTIGGLRRHASRGGLWQVG
ncbi:hypothetical protein A9X75_09295 [Brachyspira hyodysenteriae]|nr:hypothetical protein SZ48_00240 [Brachyspira hyodysenteriae]TVL44934.1 hypothetical protein A9X73_11405 [Brachyspira hyodysenteriae]TVL63671.1 hypothetical protein A9X85_11120 [Brachyspira hyodysenteriae]TVL67451.1 hypothetical protein A9X75_09295 [Brachyspira hyodysenteriae]TVL69931.1 hypothetical protein A9X74_09510 [Brachyspira hyodysenteriae]